MDVKLTVAIVTSITTLIVLPWRYLWENHLLRDKEDVQKRLHALELSTTQEKAEAEQTGKDTATKGSIGEITEIVKRIESQYSKELVELKNKLDAELQKDLEVFRNSHVQNNAFQNKMGEDIASLLTIGDLTKAVKEIENRLAGKFAWSNVERESILLFFDVCADIFANHGSHEIPNVDNIKNREVKYKKAVLCFFRIKLVISNPLLIRKGEEALFTIRDFVSMSEQVKDNFQTGEGDYMVQSVDYYQKFMKLIEEFKHIYESHLNS